MKMNTSIRRTARVLALLAAIIPFSYQTASAFSPEYKEAYDAALEWEGFKANDSGMNAVYKRLLDLMPKQQATALRAQQREWMNNCDSRAKWDVKNNRVPERYLVAATSARRQELEALLKITQQSSARATR